MGYSHHLLRVYMIWQLSVRAFSVYFLLMMPKGWAFDFNQKQMTRIIVFLALFVSLTSLLSIPQKSKFDLKASITRGQDMYATYCMSCHQEQGEGIEDLYPPLAKSDYLMADKKRSIIQVLKGATGEMKVNGKIYNADMMGFDLSDAETSDVLNYIRNSFGNKGEAVTPDQVKMVRK
jgi:mono/diheme cytochrome c family protein